MPNLSLYHLDPKSAIHVGQRGVGQEETGDYLPADSLFAALVAAYVESGSQPEQLMSQNGSDSLVTPFLLTSAFPRARTVRFYPMLPLNLLKISERKKDARLKELKAIRFLSETLFKRVIEGQSLDDWLPAKDENKITDEDQGLYMQDKKLWLTAGEVGQLPSDMQLNGDKDQQYRALRHLRVWQTNKVPRVTVDRLRNASNIFHTGRLTFSPDCGWWFGVDWQKSTQAIQKMVSQALNLLADAGLGGERAAGYGHFSFDDKVGQIKWPDPAPQQLFTTLSRYHPRPVELPGALQDDPVAYNLVSVSGWLNSPDAHTRGQAKAQRRQRLQMVAEGSVVRAVGHGPWGDITDVRPEYPTSSARFPHPVWRYGIACPVALKGENQ